MLSEDPASASAVSPPADQPFHGRALVVCDQWLGSIGYAGARALRRAGWSVQTVPEWEYVPVTWTSPAMRVVGRLLRGPAVAEFNRSLRRAAETTRPDFLLVFKGTFVRRETILRLRDLGVRCYCVFPDVSFRAHGPYIPKALSAYDWVFSTKSFGLRDMRDQLGVTRASLMLHAFDADLHRPVGLTAADRDQYGCDVSFIGTWSPKKEETLSALAKQRPRWRLRVWGAQWDRASRASGLQGSIMGRGVIGEEYVRAVAGSTINLGLLSERRLGASDGDQITTRTFEIPAMRGFMLHERTDELLEILREDDEVACFSDVDELIRKADHYLSAPEERQRIAARGQVAVTESHSWDVRMAAVIRHHVRGVGDMNPGTGQQK